MKRIKVKCPAKINLTLEILNKRPDGFHNIQSVMQTIDLFDFLTINVSASENFEIKLSGTSDEIPYDEKNLVHKAILLFIDSLRNTPHPNPLPQGEREKSTAIAVKDTQRMSKIFEKIINQRAKSLRKNSTPPEQILWYYLRDRRFDGLKFRRQALIKNYIVDFACFEKKLIIELDGSGHLENEKIKHDKKRDEFLSNEGFKVLRFFNTDISNNIESVLEEIYRHTSSTLLPAVGEGVRRTDEGKYNYKISVHIEKNIPISAGLAGGSTDAAGVLWGLNRLFDNILSKEELHGLCTKLGSDLNFCLEGGCQLATGRGEILKKLPFCEFELSLIKPKKLGISAKEAYTKFSQLESKPNLNMTKKLVDALKLSGKNARPTAKTCDAKILEKLLHNDLEVAVFDDYRELQQIKKAHPNSIMSGSGSTYFILESNISTLESDLWVMTNLSSLNYGVCECD